MTLVSVILPLYNSDKYLHEAITSICNQTFKDWELIVINEFGSSDLGVEIVKDIQKRDNRVKLIENKQRLGISESLNEGIRNAKGKYIARMDGDDIALPERLEEQFKYLENNLDVGLCGSQVEVFGDRAFDWKLEVDIEKIKTNILFYSPCVHPTIMFRKSICTKEKIYYNKNYKATEDYDFFSKVLQNNSISIVDKVLLKYRLNNDNTTFKNNDVGLVIYQEIMGRQFSEMGIKFTSEEISLLSPHCDMSDWKRKDILKNYVDFDLLLKRILIGNNFKKNYDKKYLFQTLHKRYMEFYDKLINIPQNYDRGKLECLHENSIFKNRTFVKSRGREVKNPLVSVVIPTFNSQDYILDTLWSVLKQSYRDFEVLIINEFGSNDQTLNAISLFEDSRIRIIQNEKKLGLAESLNLGIKLSRGRYIARVDADDICYPQRFQLQVEFMEMHLSYGVCGTWQHHFGINTDWIHKVPEMHEEIKAELIYNCHMCHSTLMLRKEMFIDNGLFYDRNKQAEDYELWTRAVHKMKFYNIPEVLVEYRVGEQNITQGKIEKLDKESAEIVYNTIVNNFGINIPEKHIQYLSGWKNWAENTPYYLRKRIYEDEKKILLGMWEANEKYRIYDTKFLLKTINKRWRWFNGSWEYGEEIKEILPVNILFDKFPHALVPRVVWKRVLKKTRNVARKVKNIVLGGIKKGIKKILWPIYRPFKLRVVDKLGKIHQQLWDMDGHLRDTRDSIEWRIASLENKITILEQQIILNTKQSEDLYYTRKKIENMKEGEKVIILGTPSDKLLKHHLLSNEIQKWIKSNYLDKTVYEFRLILGEIDIISLFMQINEKLNAEDLIIIQGTGIISEYDFNYYNYIKAVLLVFNSNQIIFAPHSVEYKDEKKMQKDLEIIKGMSKVKFLVADTCSYSKVKDFIPNASFCPNMEKIKINFETTNKKINGSIIVLDDKEDIFSYICKNKKINKQYKKNRRVNFELGASCSEIELNREDVLARFLKLVSEYDVIITSKVEGIKLSITSGKPIIFYNKKDNKEEIILLQSYLKYNDIQDSVYIVEEMREMEEILCEL